MCFKVLRSILNRPTNGEHQNVRVFSWRLSTIIRNHFDQRTRPIGKCGFAYYGHFQITGGRTPIITNSTCFIGACESTEPFHHSFETMKITLVQQNSFGITIIDLLTPTWNWILNFLITSMPRRQGNLLGLHADATGRRQAPRSAWTNAWSIHDGPTSASQGKNGEHISHWVGLRENLQSTGNHGFYHQI